MSEYYLNNLRKAVDFIEANLDSKISIEEVAASSGYSSYHFQRLFSAAVGEPVRDYIRKRRLTEAAHVLVDSNQRILDIALSAGFESQEAFTRAFQKMFRLPPGEYRKQKHQPYFLGRSKLTDSMIRQLISKYCIAPNIVEWDERYFIGIGRAFGEDIFNPVGELWNEFSQKIASIEHSVGTDTFGLCFGSDPSIAKNEDTALCYIAGVEVSTASTAVPDGMILRRLPRSKYVHFAHVGPLMEFQTTLDYIWGTYLPRSNYHRVEAPDLEVYPKDFDPAAPIVNIDLYIPLQI